MKTKPASGLEILHKEKAEFLFSFPELIKPIFPSVKISSEIVK